MAGLLLSPQLLGPATGLLSSAAPAVAQAATPAATGGGLLSMFAPKAAASPLYQAFDDRRDALTGFLLGGVGAESPLERMRGMAKGLAAGATKNSQENETAKWLARNYGITPEDARAMTRNSAIMNAFLKKQFDTTDGSSVYGTPIYGTDANGKTVLGVIGKDGSFQQLDTGGVTPTPGVTWQDFGTYRQGFGKGGQAATPQIGVDNYGAAADTAAGSAAGKRAGELPVMRSKALASLDALDNQRMVVEDNIGRAIQDIQANPGITTGLVGGLASAVPGSPAYALAKKLETIKANVGFDKLQSMRENSPTGGALGQVSDFENRQLQAIFGNLEQAQSADDLLYNLQLLQQVLANSKDARRRAYARDFGEEASVPVSPGGGGVVDYRDYFKD